MSTQRLRLEEIGALDQPRILIIRTSALGDIVQGLPVLESIKRQRPGAQVAWVVEKPYAPLVSGHLDLDRTIPVATGSWREKPFARSTRQSIAHTVREMRAFDAHVALDLMSNHKAGVLSRLSGAPHRIGLKGETRREPSSGMWINRSVVPIGPHAVERAGSVLGPLGLLEPSSGGEGAEPFVTERLHPEATAPHELQPGNVLVHPGAGWLNKEYPRWGEVARQLLDTTGLEVYVVTGPGEHELGEEVVRASAGGAVHWPIPNLVELIGAQRRAALVLAGDTGPMHLAHALGTPVIAVMGPTDPALHGPWMAPDQVISRRLPCSYCHRRLDGPKPCLLQIPPSEVAEAAVARLGRQANR